MQGRASIVKAAAFGLVAGLVGAAVPSAGPAQAQGGVNVGYLKCDVAEGWGFIVGTSRKLKCVFHPANGSDEKYEGKITKFGANVGFHRASVIMWSVFSPGKVDPGALAGIYGGATASAAVGGGVGANVLIGGGRKSITLQPVSLSGETGLNAAGGIAGVELKLVK